MKLFASCENSLPLPSARNNRESASWSRRQTTWRHRSQYRTKMLAKTNPPRSSESARSVEARSSKFIAWPIARNVTPPLIAAARESNPIRESGRNWTAKANRFSPKSHIPHHHHYRPNHQADGGQIDIAVATFAVCRRIEVTHIYVTEPTFSTFAVPILR